MDTQESQATTYQVGGSLPPGHGSYVERQADRDLYDRLLAGDYCFVFNCRQMGKSSLRVRVTDKLRAVGVTCVVMDPQTRGTKLSEEQWYAGTIKRLVEDLKLSQINFRDWWTDLSRQSINPVERFSYFVDGILLREIPGKVVIFVEEIDNLLSISSFDTDGFFSLIRSFYERRAEDSRYQRLSFTFLGVATPADLIRQHHTSAFNIGIAIEMGGFTWEEAQPLLSGLQGRVANPEAILRQVLHWSGGQPFLTQKLLALVTKYGDPSQDDPETLLQNLVQTHILDNWETQDTPPHLKTIRDRVWRSPEKLRGRLLGLYQQVLASPERISADETYEQTQLCLTGLTVKQRGRLCSYNPIYEAVFNPNWTKQMLAELRPSFYAEALRAWQQGDQKGAFLLRGEALQEAEAWAKGQRLSEEDEEFLLASRTAETADMARKLVAEAQAKAILQRAKEEAEAARAQAEGQLVAIEAKNETATADLEATQAKVKRWTLWGTVGSVMAG